MNILAATMPSIWFGPQQVDARYTPATELDRQLDATAIDFAQTSSGHALGEIEQELVEVFQSAAEENWDGYGATPLSFSTFRWAREFLRAVFGSFPTPEIDASPQGHISFEWTKDPRHTLSIDIDERGILYYSLLNGIEGSYGTVKFSDRIPDILLPLLAQHAESHE